MCLIGVSVTSFKLEWNNEVFVALSIMASNLHCRINIALKTIHRRPNMLLNFQEFVDTQTELRVMTILNKRLGLFHMSGWDLQVTERLDIAAYRWLSP